MVKLLFAWSQESSPKCCGWPPIPTRICSSFASIERNKNKTPPKWREWWTRKTRWSTCKCNCCFRKSAFLCALATETRSSFYPKHSLSVQFPFGHLGLAVSTLLVPNWHSKKHKWHETIWANWPQCTSSSQCPIESCLWCANRPFPSRTKRLCSSRARARVVSIAHAGLWLQNR